MAIRSSADALNVVLVHTNMRWAPNHVHNVRQANILLGPKDRYTSGKHAKTVQQIQVQSLAAAVSSSAGASLDLRVNYGFRFLNVWPVLKASTRMQAGHNTAQTATRGLTAVEMRRHLSMPVCLVLSSQNPRRAVRQSQNAFATQGTAGTQI